MPPISICKSYPLLFGIFEKFRLWQASTPRTCLVLWEISDVQGMNKEELIRAIKEVKGIKEEGKAAKAANVREAKEQAKAARFITLGPPPRPPPPARRSICCEKGLPPEETDQ